MLQIRNLSVRYGSLTILDNVSCTVEEGDWLMVVGPNGAGKSTLVGAISRSVPFTGKVLFEGQDIADLRPAQIAQNIGVVMQRYNVGYAFTVEEVVRLGRYCHSKGFLSPDSDEDAEMIEQALAMTGMAGLRKQSVTTLSGGELQRTFLAQVLAQNPRLLILDEPTNHLDLVYQKQVFELIASWLEQPGRAVISVVHDLSLARAYGTHALLLNSGKIAAMGKTNEVLTSQNLDSIYNMDVYGWMRQMLGQWE